MAKKAEKLGRVIGVRFPEGHPVWSFPAGKRANIVRELVDMALLNQYKLLSEAVSRIEDRLEAIEADAFKQPEQPREIKIDPSAFMDL